MLVVFAKPGVNFCSTFLDFVVMIGNGVFCSIIISWLIDEQNKAKEKRVQDEQRKYIFSTIKNNYIRIFERELKELSVYYDKHLANGDVEWCKEDISIKEIAQKILWLLQVIEKTEAEDDSHTITTSTIKQSEDKRKMLSSNNRIYYNQLYQNLNDIAVNYNWFYVSNILSEEQIELLKELTWNVHDVLMIEPDIGIGDGSVLEFKKIFFEKTNTFLSVLDISENHKIHVHYRDLKK